MGVSNAAVWPTRSSTSVVNGAILVQPHAGFHLLNGKFYSITKIKRRKKKNNQISTMDNDNKLLY